MRRITHISVEDLGEVILVDHGQRHQRVSKADSAVRGIRARLRRVNSLWCQSTGETTQKKQTNK